MLATFYLLLTYLVGSFPTGHVLATLYADVDVTSHGSGNIGATNVTRLLGKGMGVLTLVGDMAKGAVPVLLASFVSDSSLFPGLVALAAFSGHCWSAYMEFRGGKGVATAGGVMLALAPFATVLVAIVWIGVLITWKKASLASLVSVAVLPVLLLLFNPGVTWIGLLLGAGVAWRHQPNIRRLLRGTEV
jgi:glycerol-3-phosphate acyltransferase PlsY